MKSIALLSALFVASLGNEIKIYNNCPFTIWPGILGNAGKGQPNGGGFGLGAYQSGSVYVANDWAGRIWARTNCDGNGHCETGDCGNRIQCNGAGGVPPVSLAEIKFSGWGGLDYYDISLVDGFNLPVRMQPISGFVKTNNGRYDCNPAGCYTDINARCPAGLANRNSAGWTVSCRNDPGFFKSICPDSYSHPHDDATSTFTCKGNSQANYLITFCP